MTCRHTMQTAPIGHQDDGDGGLLELRNCVRCRTTLATALVARQAVDGCDCVTCGQLRARAAGLWIAGRCEVDCECVGCEFRRLREARAALRKIETDQAERYAASGYVRRVQG